MFPRTGSLDPNDGTCTHSSACAIAASVNEKSEAYTGPLWQPWSTSTVLWDVFKRGNFQLKFTRMRCSKN